MPQPRRKSESCEYCYQARIFFAIHRVNHHDWSENKYAQFEEQYKDTPCTCGPTIHCFSVMCAYAAGVPGRRPK